ncbi:testis-expressed protein 13D-like [Saccopteryx leptura]|uniref:testis-expressed protein 13D-like n=1 Tax=Saccopteryx leptura TaxID=249018 RepID=UPI00339CB9E5
MTDGYVDSPPTALGIEIRLVSLRNPIFTLLRHNSELVLGLRYSVAPPAPPPPSRCSVTATTLEGDKDELRSVLANPLAPHALKTPCARSELALGVRVASRASEKHVRGVRPLQQQMEPSQTAAWALASQLVRLRKERDSLVSQLRLAWQDLQQAQEQQEAVCQQLLQAKRRLWRVGPAASPPRYDVWPMNVEERNQLLAKIRKLRLAADSQRAFTSAPEALCEAEEALGPSA